MNYHDNKIKGGNKMAYTDEQIQSVCDKAADVMKDFTDVQN